MLEALADLELAAFLPRVEAELRRFNEIQTGKRNEYRRKLKEGKDVSDGRSGGGNGNARGRKSGGGLEGSTGLEDDEVAGGEEGEGEERAAKRVRREEEGGDGTGEGGGAEGQLRGNREVGKGDGDTGFDAIEAVDAAIRAEEEEEEGEEEEQGDGEEDMEGEDEDEDDDEDESHDNDSDPENWSPDPMAERMDIADANIEGMGRRSDHNITDDSDEDDTD